MNSPLTLVYVGTVGKLLDRFSGDKFIWVFCESFLCTGYVTEMRKLLRKYYDNSIFAVDGFDAVFVL